MRSFGELEAAIMDAIWSTDQPLTVRDVLGRLRRDPEPAYTTVQTVMDLLHRKGWLTRAKDGRAYRFAPTQSREDYTAGLIGQALETTPDRDAALLRLVETMDAADVAALRAALESVRRAGRA